ncbi:MAG: hypothetical protein ACLSSX_09255, partial [Dysosmobacter sp.]
RDGTVCPGKTDCQPTEFYTIFFDTSQFKNLAVFHDGNIPSFCVLAKEQDCFLLYGANCQDAVK